MNISNFIYISILPVLSGLYIESKEKLINICQTIIKYTVLIFLPISFGIFLTADRIIEILYPKNFYSSGIVLKITAWIIITGFAQTLFSAILTGIDRQKEKVVLIGVNFAVSVPLNFFLIYFLNYTGAAIAKLISTVLGLLFFAFLVYRYLDFSPLLKLALKPLVACLVMTICGYYYRDMGLNYFIMFSVIIYMVSLLVLGTFTKQEIIFIKEIMIIHPFKKTET